MKLKEPESATDNMDRLFPVFKMLLCQNHRQQVQQLGDHGVCSQRL